MSNSLAIATVTDALQVYLAEVADAAVVGAKATVGRPDEVTTTDPVVNIYLYRGEVNSNLRNLELPVRNSRGELISQPVYALDLDYLLTFMAQDDTELQTQRLMGATVVAMHTQPILDKSYIAAAIANNAYLADSDLASQAEKVRFIPYALSVEELSRIWTMIPSFKYELSVTYRASVVLLSPDVTPRTALPVRSRFGIGVPATIPVIASVQSTTNPTAPIFIGSRIQLDGQGFGGLMEVSIEGSVVAAESASNNRVIVTLDVPPFDSASLRAGTRQVTVRRNVPGVSIPGAYSESNALTFQLRPSVTSVTFVPGGPGAPVVTTTLAPPVGPGQRCVLFLNGFDDVEDAYVISGPSIDSETASVDFDVTGVPAGSYLARVDVDGSSSALTADEDPLSANYKRYVAPLVTVTA